MFSNMQAAFVEGSQLLAVTAEATGRLIIHNVSSYLSLTAKLAGKLSKLMQPSVVSPAQPWGEVLRLAGLRPASTCQIEATSPDINPSTLLAVFCEGLLLVLGSMRLCIGLSLPTFAAQSTPLAQPMASRQIPSFENHANEANT